MVSSPPEATEINVWIDSPGGDAHAAYKLVVDLRCRCSKLHAIVPDYAKSAATLLVMGMDSIFMAGAAELGPLDAQVEHPAKEGLMLSALDIADSLESMARTAMDLAISGGASVIQYTGLPRSDVLTAVFGFMAQFLQPTVEKLDPHLIHQAANQLKIAERYAEIMLANRNLTPKSGLSPDAALDLVQKLVNEYPAHGFVISRDEARKLGLPVKDAETHPRWNKVREFYETFQSRRQPMILVMPDSGLDSQPDSLTHASEESDEQDGQEEQRQVLEDSTADRHQSSESKVDGRA